MSNLKSMAVWWMSVLSAAALLMPISVSNAAPATPTQPQTAHAPGHSGVRTTPWRSQALSRTAHAPGSSPLRLSSRARPQLPAHHANPGASATMALTTATVHGRVLKGGVPVEGVSISADCDVCTTIDTGGLTAADGSYTISGDPANYEIWVGNFGSSVNSTTSVMADATVATTANAPDLAVFDATATEDGTINATTGGPVMNAEAVLGIPSQIFAGSIHDIAVATTDSAGSFSMVAAPGAYDFQASASAYHSLDTGLVTIPRTQNSALAPFTRKISGRVLAGGAIVPNAFVSANCVDDVGSFCDNTTQTFDDGSYTVWGDAGKYEVYVSISNPGTFNSIDTLVVDARNPGTYTGKDLQVQSAAGTTLQGTVTSLVSHLGLAKAFVSLSIPSKLDPTVLLFVGESTSSTNGDYSIGAAPATYSVFVDVPGYRPPTASPSTVDEPTLTVAPGVNTHSFALTPFSTSISGRVLNGTTPVPGIFTSWITDGANCLLQDGVSDATGAFTTLGDACKYEGWVEGSQGRGNSTPALGTTVVDATGGGVLTGHDLHVQTSDAVVSGTVSGGGGIPVGGALVLYEFPFQLFPSDFLSARSETTQWSGPLAGQYRMGMGAGSYHVTVLKAGSSGASVAGVSAPGTRDFSLNIPAPPISHTILDATGFLADTTGQVQLLPQPVRLVDTRTSGGPIAAGTSRCFAIAGMGGIPASAAGAVLNVTGVSYTDFGWLTLYPFGQAVPSTSTVNFDTRDYAIANGAIARIGSGGQVCVNAGRSASNVILDATGFLADTAGQIQMLPQPARVIDTRLAGGLIAANQTRCFDVVNTGGIPSTAAGLVLNVTGVGYSDFGWLTLYSNGQPLPATSTLNFDPNAEYAVANGAIVQVGNAGQLCVNAGRSASHVILDVAGYLANTSGQVQLLTQPVRLVDTRITGGPIPAGQSRCFSVVNAGGIPASAAGILLNMTGVGYTDLGWLTAYPNGQAVPSTSTLNFDTHQYAIANGAIARTGVGGYICTNVGHVQ